MTKTIVIDSQIVYCVLSVYIYSVYYIVTNYMYLLCYIQLN